MTRRLIYASVKCQPCYSLARLPPYLPEHILGRKPIYGALVRPLPRKHKSKTLNATKPDENYVWVENGHEIRVEIWRKLILNKVIPGENNQTFDVYAFYDPAFNQP